MHLRAIAFLLVVAAPGALAARSLEQDYARLCLDPAKTSTGMCRELAAALNAKGIPLPVAAPVPTPSPEPAPMATAASPARASAAPWRERWGVFADMIGKEIVSTARIETNGGPMVTEVRTRLDWVVPGEKMISRLQTDGAWRDMWTTEWDAVGRRLVTVTPSTTTYMRVLPDGSVEAPESTELGQTTRTMTREVAPGRYEVLAEVKKDGVWTALMRNTMQVSSTPTPVTPPVVAAPAPVGSGKDEEILRQAQAKRDEIARRLDEQRRMRELAERERLQEEQDAEYAQLEAQRIQRQAEIAAQDAADEQALQDSLDQLNRTVANAQSRVMHASADRQSGAPSAPIHGYNETEDKSEASAMPGQQAMVELEAYNSDDDANQCVTGATLRVNDTFQGNTAAYVTNGCGQPVDVRICLMTENKGWNCGMTYGLSPQSSWSWSSLKATGNVFQDARISGSKRTMQSP
jgi:hypothetical protein